MENELTLRDKIAMGMSSDTLPELKSKEAIEYIGEKYGLKWDDDDLIVQIEFAFAYQAIMRYKYADAMLKIRATM